MVFFGDIISLGSISGTPYNGVCLAGGPPNQHPRTLVIKAMLIIVQCLI